MAETSDLANARFHHSVDMICIFYKGNKFNGIIKITKGF